MCTFSWPELGIAQPQFVVFRCSVISYFSSFSSVSFFQGVVYFHHFHCCDGGHTGVRGGGRVQSDDLRPDVPVGGPGICGDGPLLLLFIGDDLSKNFNFFSSNFKILPSSAPAPTPAKLG